MYRIQNAQKKFTQIQMVIKSILFNAETSPVLQIEEKNMHFYENNFIMFYVQSAVLFFKFPILFMNLTISNRTIYF